MSVETIARRYGAALADVVLKTGETDAVKAELGGWVELISSSPDLGSVFRNPSIAHADKEKVLENLIERTRPTRTTGNFLRVLLKNGRITELSEISTRFAEILDERNGIEKAYVTSARDLNDDQKADLRTNLERTTGKKIVLDFDVDRNIIGGVIARVGSTVYDGSVRTALENFKTELTGA